MQKNTSLLHELGGVISGLKNIGFECFRMKSPFRATSNMHICKLDASSAKKFRDTLYKKDADLPSTPSLGFRIFISDFQNSVPSMDISLINQHHDDEGYDVIKKEAIQISGKNPIALSTTSNQPYRNVIIGKSHSVYETRTIPIDGKQVIRVDLDANEWNDFITVNVQNVPNEEGVWKFGGLGKDQIEQRV